MQDERITMLRGAGSAILYLVGSLLLAFAIGFKLSEMQIHNIEIIGFSIMFALCVAGGALWGRALAQITGTANTRPLITANAVSYAPSVIGAALGLGAVESIVFNPNLDIPIHVLFEIVFTTALFLVTAISGLANGIALKDARAAGRLALFTCLAAATTFLVVTLLLDAAGRRVGAPGAAETFNMLGN